MQIVKAKTKLGWEKVNSINLPLIAFTGTKDKSIVYEGATHDFTGFGDQIVRDVLEFITK